MSAPAAIEEHPLRRNRDFNLLWVGQVASELGAHVSAIAFPLLVLATTGSPVRAGIVAAAGTLADLVLAVPARALVDRWNQKRVMIVTDSVCAAAFGSLGLAVALDALTFGHIVAVAFIEGTGFVLFEVAEGSALQKVVADHHLDAALARNSARAHTAALAGQPLGGALFALGRAVPVRVRRSVVPHVRGGGVANQDELPARRHAGATASARRHASGPELVLASAVPADDVAHLDDAQCHAQCALPGGDRDRSRTRSLGGADRLALRIRRSRWNPRLAGGPRGSATRVDTHRHHRYGGRRCRARAPAEHPSRKSDTWNCLRRAVHPEPGLVDRCR